MGLWKNILQNVLWGRMEAGKTEALVDGHCLEAGDLLVELEAGEVLLLH